VIRYSWYALNTLGVVPAAHTWLRFTTFLPLYPLGVFGEMAVMRAALPAAAGTMVLGALPIESFTYYVVYPLWLSGLALLYTHMLSQRTKVLAKARAQAGKNKDA
jgi:very-long-chain (3R)-3-hydroxyacyl-CoA dehydratase